MVQTKSDGRPQAGPAPDHAALREAALRHLSRYAATQAGLVRVLDRRIARWARAADAAPEQEAAARRAAREVAHALTEAGIVDDAAFAVARTRRLVRAGRSRRAVAAHLSAKGVDPEAAGAAMPTAEAEFLAAIAFAKRRRIGPFAPADAEIDPQRALAAMARAGFPRDLAERALGLDRETADQALLAFKQG